jgi:hypothetical protein
MNELKLKLASLNGMSDAFAGGLHEEFENMLRNRTDGQITIEKATSALMDVIQEHDWDGYHLAIIKALKEDEEDLKHITPEFKEFLAWFPCFAEREIETATEVIEFALSPAVTSGSMAAARFVLAVWNPRSNHEGIGKFELSDVGSWDGSYRKPFARWAKNPFWY